jgi:hypothetical protein
VELLRALRLVGVRLFAGALAALAGANALAAPSEYQLKAVFLFNFAQFIDWPEQAFAQTEAPLVICVLGPDPFGTDLDAVVRGEHVKGRPLVVQRLRDVKDVEACHILFVNRTAPEGIDAVVTRLNGSPVLTVSDAPDSAQNGVVIQFVNERNRIRLRINVDAAKAAGLTISSKLLRPAEIVGERGG